MDKIGLQAVLEDSSFQAGLARYVAGLGKAESATQKTASAMTAFGHTISTAIGTAIGNLSSRIIPQISDAIMGPVNITRAWGEQLDSLGDIFGLTDQAGAGFAIAMKKVGISVDEGAGSFSYFSRQVSDTKTQLADAASNFAIAASDITSAHADAVNRIARDWQQAQSTAAEGIATVWSDLAERRADIESSLADNIAGIQERLQERLADFAEQRSELQRDTAKSLAKLESDTRSRLRSARSGRERREIKREAAERKKEILEEAAERERQIAKQEAREKQQAAKQIALAEKVANKQIEAAEKAANKQVAAIEKALAKQAEAMKEQQAEAQKQFEKQMRQASKALADVADKSPLSKALKTLGLDFRKITDESRPFEERLGDIMDAFAKLPAGVDASALAIQLFGRAGIKWLDFLRQGRKGLEEAKALGIELGLVLDSAQAEEYGRSLNMLQLHFDAIGITIGRAVLPYVNQFVKSLAEGLRAALPMLQDLLKRMTEGFKSKGFEGLAEGMQAWADDAKNKAAITRALETIGKFVGDVLQGLLSAGSFVWKTIGKMFDAFGTWASGEGKPFIEQTMYRIGTVLANALTLFIQTSAAVGNFLIAMGARMIQWLASDEGKQLTKSVAAAFIAGFSAAFAEANPFKGLPGYGKENAPGMGFARGGWVPRTGMAMVHAGEYVLNRRQAMAWAPALTRNTTNNNYSFSNTWTGNASAIDRTELARIAEDSAYRGIRKAMGTT